MDWTRKKRIENDSKGLGLNNWKNGVDTKIRNTLRGVGVRAIRKREIRVCFGHGKYEMPTRHRRGELK